MLPLQGFMVALVTFNLFILVWWLLGYGTIPNASGQAGLYWGHTLGGPLLAMGAVFMIGCEVRTYARPRLGYSTALAALPRCRASISVTSPTPCSRRRSTRWPSVRA